jgi:hypothetical protein
VSNTKLVCVHCQTEMKPSHIGTLVVETSSFGPYKVWAADTLKCPGCGIEVVYGFSDKPVRQDHWTDDFHDWLEKEKARAGNVVYDNEKPTSRQQ